MAFVLLGGGVGPIGLSLPEGREPPGGRRSIFPGVCLLLPRLPTTGGLTSPAPTPIQPSDTRAKEPYILQQLSSAFED